MEKMNKEVSNLLNKSSKYNDEYYKLIGCGELLGEHNDRIHLEIQIETSSFLFLYPLSLEIVSM